MTPLILQINAPKCTEEVVQALMESLRREADIVVVNDPQAPALHFVQPQAPDRRERIATAVFAGLLAYAGTRDNWQMGVRIALVGADELIRQLDA